MSTHTSELWNNYTVEIYFLVGGEILLQVPSPTVYLA